jgi:hypothetical protein
VREAQVLDDDSVARAVLRGVSRLILAERQPQPWFDAEEKTERYEGADNPNYALTTLLVS